MKGCKDKVLFNLIKHINTKRMNCKKIIPPYKLPSYQYLSAVGSQLSLSRTNRNTVGINTIA